jgi:hypothetical protein
MIRSSSRFLLAALLCAAAIRDVHAQDYQAAQADESPVLDLGSAYGQPRFSATAALLYLQPGSGNLEYGTLVSPLPVPSPSWANQAVSPNFSPAFRIGFRYLVTESNDIQLNWTHLDASDSASVVARPDQFVGPAYEIGPDANVYKIARGTAHFGYDAINLDAGQLWGGNGPFQVRVFGGVQIARLRQNLFASFESYNGQTASANDTNSLFTGAGPRVGVKAQCSRGNFQFLGEAAGTVLIGVMQSRMDFTATAPALAGLGITPPNTQSLTSPNAAQVIPGLDGRLGSAYTLRLTNYSLLRIEAGYQAAVYVNAVNQYSVTGVVVPPVAQSVGVFLESAQRVQNNFTVQGPYLAGSVMF